MRNRGKCVGDHITSFWAQPGEAGHKKRSVKQTWFFILQEPVNL